MSSIKKKKKRKLKRRKRKNRKVRYIKVNSRRVEVGSYWTSKEPKRPGIDPYERQYITLKVHASSAFGSTSWCKVRYPGGRLEQVSTLHLRSAYTKLTTEEELGLAALHFLD